MQPNTFLRNFSRLIMIAVIAAFLPTCGKETVRLDRPIPKDLFQWGSQPETVKSKLTASGWTVAADTGDSLSFSLPADELKELQSARLDLDDAAAPYQLEYYFNNQRVSMVRIIRRDTTSNIDSFIKDAIAQYDGGNPAWSGEEVSRTTETGNEFIDSASIYETPEILIKVLRVKVKPAEKDLQNGMLDEVEMRIFSKAENEGISVSGLAGQ